MWFQKQITLPAYSRGFHLITDKVINALPELNSYQAGILHLFMQHTSASLTLNENADPTVRKDMENHFHYLAPENQPYYQHTLEGPDDMPVHIKSSLLGASLTIPITSGQLALGTWQGIWLGEHRVHGGQRRIIATIQGASN